MSGSVVLIGNDHGRLKVFGPFPTAENAREFCNALGMPQIEWSVEPLMGVGAHEAE